MKTRRNPAFWNLIRADDGKSAELRISGDIVSDDSAWFYRWFGDPCATPGSVRAQLADLDGVPLTVWIDSYGGDVVAASAIYTALMEYPGDITGKVDGAAYSAASVIAMACKTLLMSPTATMMIHAPWTETWGNATELRHTAGILDEISEGLIGAYEIKTGKSRAEIMALLEAETWMGARKAVEMGFADGVLYAAESDAGQEAIVAQARVVYARLRSQAQPAADEAGRTREGAKGGNGYSDGFAAGIAEQAEDWTEDAEMALAIESGRT